MDANVDSREAGKILLENIELFEQSYVLMTDIIKEALENLSSFLSDYLDEQHYPHTPIDGEEQDGGIISIPEWKLVDEDKYIMEIYYLSCDSENQDQINNFWISDLIGVKGIKMNFLLVFNNIAKLKTIVGTLLKQQGNNIVKLKDLGLDFNKDKHIISSYSINKQELIDAYMNDDYSVVYEPALVAFKKLEAAFPVIKELYDEVEEIAKSL